MDTRTHRYPLMILESHLDTFGHVNHATYLQILEQARWEMITEKGYGLNRIRETGLGPIILDVSIQYRKELRLRQNILIDTRFLSYSKSIAKVDHEIVDEAGAIYCTAEITFALFDVKKRKIVRPTRDWLYAIGVPTDKLDTEFGETTKPR